MKNLNLVRIIIHTFGILSLISIIILNFTEIRFTSSLLINKIEIINSLINNFSIGTFTTYIFFLVVVEMKEYLDRRKISPLIAIIVANLILKYKYFYCLFLIKQAGIDEEEIKSTNPIELISENWQKIEYINYSNKSDGENKNVFEEISNMIQDLNLSIVQLQSLSNYISIDIFEILNQILNNQYFKDMNKTKILDNSEKILKYDIHNIKLLNDNFKNLERISGKKYNKYLIEDIMKMNHK